MNRFAHWAEAALVFLLAGFFRLLPLPVASAVGGLIGRTVGPLLPAHATARKNLTRVMPGLAEAEQKRILRGMWENLGRVAAELPSLPGSRLTSRMIVHGVENLPPAGKPVIYFSGHLGNWELTYTIAHDAGLPIVIIYRAANNPYVDKLIRGARESHCKGLFPKGHRGAAGIVRALKQNMSLAMLVDQKMNDGIAVPFFGIDAMTAPAIAQFALRYDLPIIPARVLRKDGCHFEATVYPPLAVARTGDDEKDTLAIMIQINAMIESWVREHPEQWFWVHRRWPKEEI
jgi:KDO2-lipid IV(A) lauroyltransferase